MNHEELLYQLESVASSLGISVSYETFRSSDWRTSSGLCRIMSERRLLVDKSLSAEEKVSAIASSLKGENLDNIFCQPIVRKLLEEEAC